MKLSLPLLLAAAAHAQGPIRGFSAEGAARERALEAKLLAVPDARRIEAHMKAMASEPHHAGSPASRKVAEYALSQLRAAGLEAKIETFEALLPYPQSRLLTMGKFSARLAEPNFAEDPDSTDRNQLPTYNAYSADGDVTAPLVYVNYGVPEDYEHLKKQGIDVRGKIVLARYGQSWRGVKPKVAAEHGAIGCLIFSDPKDDGYFRGDVYPAGAYRCEYGVQRGSVMDMSIHVGDPLSPGFASEPGGARRLTRGEAKTLMPIPVLPISYGDAKPLLEALAGPLAPENWRGALPIPYKLGPGATPVRLKLTHDWGTRPVHNVIATIPGSVNPDEWVIYGNHHDAWVNGANDPVSGAAAVLETARAFGELYKTGWRPRRTLVFALWDAEEFGLIGSTEWVEKHLPELKQKAVAYFNSDSNGKGPLGLGASPALNLFLEQIARDSKDPATGESILPALLKVQRPFEPGPLGSGSDYVGFVHHAGIAGVNFGFSGSTGGVYHSIYDSFAWYKRFSDGEFIYGRGLAQVAALSLARMSEAPIVPFEFTRAAATIRRYWREVDKLAADKNVGLPNVAGALDELDAAARQFEARYAAAGRGTREVYLTERALLLPDGLPGRPWYRNAISAPGQYTGYGAKTIAGVRESLELGQRQQAVAQARAFSAAIANYAAAIHAAAAKLQP
ncbi:MAG: M28 family metallopeptidase [Acidobacteriota bacterium]